MLGATRPAAERASGIQDIVSIESSVASWGALKHSKPGSARGSAAYSRRAGSHGRDQARRRRRHPRRDRGARGGRMVARHRRPSRRAAAAGPADQGSDDVAVHGSCGAARHACAAHRAGACRLHQFSRSTATSSCRVASAIPSATPVVRATRIISAARSQTGHACRKGSRSRIRIVGKHGQPRIAAILPQCSYRLP